MQLKRLRIAAHMSQAYLAEQLGVNQTAISQWERGTAYPTADKLPKLACILGTTVDALLEEEDDALCATQENS